MTVAAVVAALGWQPRTAAAAPIITVEGPTNPLGPDLDFFTFSFNGNGATEIDTLDFRTSSDVGFNQIESDPFMINFIPDSGDTDFLGNTTLSRGVLVIGGMDDASVIRGAFAQMGDNLGDFNDPFAQLVVPSGTGGTFTVRYAGDGEPVFEDDWLYGAPFGNHTPCGDTSPCDTDASGGTRGGRKRRGGIGGDTGNGTEGPVVSISPPAAISSDLDLYTVHLDGNGADFDTVGFSLEPLTVLNQLETDPRAINFNSGNADTDFLASTTAPYGLTVITSEDSENRLRGAIMRVGGTLADFDGDIAQFVVPRGGGAILDVEFVRDGFPVVGEFMAGGRLFANSVIPEPGSLLLASLGLCAVAARRGQRRFG